MKKILKDMGVRPNITYFFASFLYAACKIANPRTIPSGRKVMQGGGEGEKGRRQEEGRQLIQ
jgi:hypothetical protein